MQTTSVTQFSQQTNQEKHHSLLEIGQQQVTSKQVSDDRTLLLEKDTDSNPKNIAQYVSNFKHNDKTILIKLILGSVHVLIIEDIFYFLLFFSNND